MKVSIKLNNEEVRTLPVQIKVSPAPKERKERRESKERKRER